MQTVPLREGFFEGAVSIETGEGWQRPWRLPFSELRLFPDELLREVGGMGAGVRLRFKTNADRLGASVVPTGEDRLFDLTIDGELVAAAGCAAGCEKVCFDGLPSGEKVVELWLPQAAPVAVRDLLVDDGATAAVVEDNRPRWITYGSSITHCSAAASPSRTWPALVARKHKLNLTCLGYSGQCHLDPLIAMMIREMPARFISLKVGINICGNDSLSPRTFAPAILAFVRIIREKHSDIPIAVISPIVSPPRETQLNNVGFCLTAMREEVRDAVARLADCGDANVYYFDGLELFDRSLVPKCMPDELHPNAEGYEVLGRNFSRVVMAKIPLAR